MIIAPTTRDMSQVLDREAVLERVGGDAELLEELVGMYDEDAPKAVADIQNGLAGKDATALERAAHRLKGSLVTLGADAASDAAFSLEKMGRSGDLSVAEAALDALQAEMARLRPELEALLASIRTGG